MRRRDGAATTKRVIGAKQGDSTFAITKSAQPSQPHLPDPAADATPLITANPDWSRSC